MAPFAGDAIPTAEERLADDNPATDPGAENDAEDDIGVGCGAIDCFGKGEAIGIVLEPHRAAKPLLEVAIERLAVERGAV